MAKLKVYRTPIGFHDAYVAASSRKAALQAWGSTHDLFARGVAEVVDDPALTAEPLASPGTVVRRSRGSAAEQLAALPADRPKRKASATATASEVTGAKARPPVRRAREPRPDRSRLTEAEDAATEAAARANRALRALRAEEAALAKRRRTMEREQEDERRRLEAIRTTAAEAYDSAMRRWRG